MAHQNRSRETSHGCRLRITRRIFALFANLLFLSGLMIATHAYGRNGHSLEKAAPSAQQPAGASNAAKDEQDVRVLELGKPIERELAGGQSHAYQITLAEGQFLNVSVEQRGIDVVVRLSGPDGKQIAEFDSEIRRQGQETVTQVAEAGGSYRLNVQAKDKGAPAGRYEVRVVELRAATEQDRAVQEARNLNTEVRRLYRAGKYDEALPLAGRVLELREKALGPEHTEVAAALNNLALLYVAKNAYAKAESLYKRALAIREKVLEPEHPSIAISFNSLANLYWANGDYVKAEPLYQRALAIREKAFGSEHPDVAAVLSNLANIYSGKGDYAQAELLYQRALVIQEKAFGPGTPGTAGSLNNLAEIYRRKGDLAKVEPLYQRVLSIWEKALGPDHPEFGRSLNNLAELYWTKRAYERAEPLYQRALEIREKALGPDHLDVAQSLNDLAELYQAEHEYGKAEPLHQRALQIREKTLGADHPDVAQSLNNLALLSTAKADLVKAVMFQLRANAINQRNLTINLATGSERQKLAYFATLAEQANQTISLHVHNAPNDSRARSLAATAILQRKGRVLDAMSDSLSALRRRLDTQDRNLLDDLSNTRARLANLSFRDPNETSLTHYQAETKRLREQAEKIEAEISTRSAEFRTQSQAVTLEAVQTAIPPAAMLVEFFSYLPYDAMNGKWGAPRYVAYAFAHQGDPGWVDLGEAQEVDRAVAALREALRSPNRGDVKRLARALDEEVMRPVRQLLGETRNLFLSPDGALNLVPFGALVDEQNHYLIENYSFTYLTSGRDLLRLQARTPSRQVPIVVANPQFDLSQYTIASNQTDSQNTEARRSTDFTLKSFDPLPSTAVEARAIGAILSGAKVLAGAQATEAAIKQVSGPNILHVATHGFFLPDQKSEFASTNSDAEEKKGMLSEDPLLRSGLVLAGANQRRSGAGEDGILTASEVAGLDLLGTKLVVLSACDTGLGEVKNGDGVYGLRRALVLAGSESQVMSLWKVDDKATRELMVDYYTELKQGEGRSEALRNVQLRMIRNRDRRHPFYWAGFIASGEWANLEGKR